MEIWRQLSKGQMNDVQLTSRLARSAWFSPRAWATSSCVLLASSNNRLKFGFEGPLRSVLFGGAACVAVEAITANGSAVWIEGAATGSQEENATLITASGEWASGMGWRLLWHLLLAQRRCRRESISLSHKMIANADCISRWHR